MTCGRFRDVDADNREIPAVQFENVRAPLACSRLRAIGVRIGTKSSGKHMRYVTTVKYVVNQVFA